MLTVLKHYRKSESKNQYFTHVHDQCEMLYVLQGEGIEMLRNRERDLLAGNLYFYPPAYPHNTRSSEDKHYVCYVVNFDEVLLKRALLPGSPALRTVQKLMHWVQSRDETRLPLPQPSLQAIAHALERLQSTQFKATSTTDWEKRLMLEEILLSIDKVMFPRPAVDKQATLIETVCDYIRTHFRADLTVDEILRVCSLSRSHFFAVFKKETGMTFVEFLTQCRLQHAKHLLRETQRPVTDIAHACGFHSYSHFCYTFSKKTGMAPRVFRRKLDTGNLTLGLELGTG